MAKRKVKRTKKVVLVNFLDPLVALQRLIEHFDNKGVVIGGLAASLLGQPRLTVDLDAVILLSTGDIRNLIEAAANEGMTTRTASAEAFAQKNRVLLLRHVHSGINIDIFLGVLPFEVEMIVRGQETQLGEIRVRLATPEDLIIMKAVAHRPKDLEDIKAVAASHPKLDRQRIQYWLEQFDADLESPNLWKEIEALL